MTKRTAPPRRMRYYQHTVWRFLAKTTDDKMDAVYQANGYRPITAKQYAAAKAKSDREDERYERAALRIIHGR